MHSSTISVGLAQARPNNELHAELANSTLTCSAVRRSLPRHAAYPDTQLTPTRSLLRHAQSRSADTPTCYTIRSAPLRVYCFYGSKHDNTANIMVHNLTEGKEQRCGPRPHLPQPPALGQSRTGRVKTESRTLVPHLPSSAHHTFVLFIKFIEPECLIMVIKIC